MKHIRDPLYGYISVSDAELRVIGNPAVQRLRCINQLGLSSAVYPGATHTRFEHSLGVMHLAGQMAESLNLSDSEVRAYRLAGLLHDVGHAPFSHATERIMEDRLGINHETQSCRIVAGIANTMGDAFPGDPELVINAIQGNAQYNIVAGAVDVDRMDYLRRDAFQTGLEHGNIDTQTIIHFAKTHNGDIIFSHKALQALEALFTARFHMTKSVYEHHTSNIVEMMLQRAVETYLDETETDPNILLQWDDRQLHTHLLKHDGIADTMYGLSDEHGDWSVDDAPRVENSLYGRVSTRNLYKRALILNATDIGRDELTQIANNLDDIHAAEETIATTANVPTSEVIVDPPTTPSGETPDVRVLWGENVRPVSEVSSLPETIVDSEWRTSSLGVYAPEERLEVVEAAAREYFNAE